MVQFQLPVDEAFSHLFLLGLASILEDADKTSARTCSLQWVNRMQAELRTNDDTPLTLTECSETVLRHAQRWNDSEWLSPALSARQKVAEKLADREAWERLQRGREAAIDMLQTPLDRRYIGALGEPSYWSGSLESNGYSTDNGASRWEMVTRNRGQEFMGGRLRPLAAAVSQRSVEAVESGLSGKTVTDEVGHDSAESRTPTGLRRPSRTDNAQAWCALFGVSAFSLGRTTTNTKSTTSAMFQLHGQFRFATLPLWKDFWTLEKYRAVARSASLMAFGISQISTTAAKQSFLTPESAHAHLSEEGVIGIELFSQYVSGNKSAPERWMEKGRFVSLL
ncbi:MAG: hypothetical protein LKJ47_08665 [Bifidobacteriaceae bacterium]|nr:hypothetical protein [Bifidobacteriaceae bacterium]